MPTSTFVPQYQNILPTQSKKHIFSIQSSPILKSHHQFNHKSISIHQSPNYSPFSPPAPIKTTLYSSFSSPSKNIQFNLNSPLQSEIIKSIINLHTILPSLHRLQSKQPFTIRPPLLFSFFSTKNNYFFPAPLLIQSHPNQFLIH